MAVQWCIGRRNGFNGLDAVLGIITQATLPTQHMLIKLLSKKTES